MEFVAYRFSQEYTVYLHSHQKENNEITRYLINQEWKHLKGRSKEALKRMSRDHPSRYNLVYHSPCIPLFFPGAAISFLTVNWSFDLFFSAFAAVVDQGRGKNCPGKWWYRLAADRMQRMLFPAKTKLDTMIPGDLGGNLFHTVLSAVADDAWLVCASSACVPDYLHWLPSPTPYISPFTRSVVYVCMKKGKGKEEAWVVVVLFLVLTTCTVTSCLLGAVASKPQNCSASPRRCRPRGRSALVGQGGQMYPLLPALGTATHLRIHGLPIQCSVPKRIFQPIYGTY